MSRKKSRSSPQAAAAPQITAAALPSATPAVNAGGGIRSAPTQNMWRNWRAETAILRQQRVQKSRFLQETLPFIGYCVSQPVEEAIGNGLVPTSESKTATFKKEATAYFDRWASSKAIDIRRRFNFYSSQTMLGTAVVGDGEVMALKIADNRPEAIARPLTDTSFRRLQLQFLTTDQIGNGAGGSREFLANGSDLTWDGGIQFDGLDIARAFRVLKQKSSTLSATAAYDQRPAAQMLHIFDDRTLNQRHGTPWLFNSERSLFDSIDLSAAERFGTKLRAYFVGAVTTPTGDVAQGMRTSVKKGETTENGVTSDNGLRYIELAGGISIPVFKTGEALSFFQGNPLSMAEIITRCWNEAVYSMKLPPEYMIGLDKLGSGAVRMVLRKVQKTFDRIRRVLRENYCQAVWEWIIGDAIEQGLPWTKDADGRVVADWREVNWKGGIDPSIDAGRDERAEQEKLRSFTGTIEMYCDKFGLDGTAVRHGRLMEIADNIRHGASIGLPWFMCIDPQTVQSMTALAQAQGIDVTELIHQIKVLEE